MNIKDYFRVFVNTYKTVNSQKLEAKKILKEWKSELKKLKQKRKKLEVAEKSLRDVYLLLDKNERQTYIQETLDLLDYGPKSSMGNRYCGQRHYYQNEYERMIRQVEIYIQDINEYISEGRYDEVLQYKDIKIE